MSSVVHLIASTSSDIFSPQITPDDAVAKAWLDNDTHASSTRVKAKKLPVNCYVAKLGPFGIEATPLGLVRPSRSKIEKFGVAQGVHESGWITLHADAEKTGMHTQGRWQADVEIVSNLPRVLLAQIFPTCIERTAQELGFESMRAVVSENMWIDILLHQIQSTDATLCTLSMLELAAYCIVNDEVKLVKSVKSSPMPMQMLSVFTLGYRLKNGKITIDICSDLDRLTTTNIDIENFGQTLPIVKVRSGRALPNGIFRAKYRQIVSWSA